MQAKLAKKNDVVVVSLSGHIDVEFAEPFREACFSKIVQKGKKIIFDLADLHFVGSNGITPFVKTIVDLHSNNGSQLKFCQVGSEFQKIFAASPLNDVEIYETKETAILSFDESPEANEEVRKEA